MKDMGMSEDKEEMNSLPSSFDDFSEEDQQEGEEGKEGSGKEQAEVPSGSNPNLFYNDGDDADIFVVYLTSTCLKKFKTW